MRAVSPAKRDLTVDKGNQAVVGNSDTMGVPAQIAEHVLRAAEGRFAAYDPFITEHAANKGMKRLRVGKVLQFAIELNGTLGELTLERFGKLRSKDFLQHLFRQKEMMLQVYRNPALMIERQSARRNDAVDMRMVQPAPTIP